MPDEVYDMWISPIAKEYGWPFVSVTESLEETKWKYVLARTPLEIWFRCEWELMEFQLSVIPFSDGSRMSVGSLIQRCKEGRDTIFAGVSGSEERFKACADFIAANNRLPKPIVGLIRNRKFEIMDGNHRIAALLSLRPRETLNKRP